MPICVFCSHTIYTYIPTVSSVVIQATLPIPVQNIPSISPVRAELVGTQTKLVFLHPVFILEITWEDFMRGKVNQL